MDVCLLTQPRGREGLTLTGRWVEGTGPAPSQAVQSKEHETPCQSCLCNTSAVAGLSTARQRTHSRLLLYHLFLDTAGQGSSSPTLPQCSWWSPFLRLLGIVTSHSSFDADSK